MEDIAVDQPETPLETFGGEHLLADDQLAHPRRMVFEHREHRLDRRAFLLGGPFQLGVELLAEQAGDVGSGGIDQTWIDGRGDQHLDNRRVAPAQPLCVIEGPVHVVERRGHDDPGGQVLARTFVELSGERGEAGQSR